MKNNLTTVYRLYYLIFINAFCFEDVWIFWAYICASTFYLFEDRRIGERRAELRHVFTRCDRYLRHITKITFEQYNDIRHFHSIPQFKKEYAMWRTNLVSGVICSRVLHLHKDKSVEEIGRNHVRNERCGLLLKNCGHNVIPYVPLPLDLLIENIHHWCVCGASHMSKSKVMKLWMHKCEVRLDVFLWGTITLFKHSNYLLCVSFCKR